MEAVLQARPMGDDDNEDDGRESEMEFLEDM